MLKDCVDCAFVFDKKLAYEFLGGVGAELSTDKVERLALGDTGDGSGEIVAVEGATAGAVTIMTGSSTLLVSSTVTGEAFSDLNFFRKLLYALPEGTAGVPAVAALDTGATTGATTTGASTTTGAAAATAGGAAAVAGAVAVGAGVALAASLVSIL